MSISLLLGSTRVDWVPDRAALVAVAFVFGILAGDQWPIEASGLLHATLAVPCVHAADTSAS